jgi:hypothetical protein
MTENGSEAIVFTSLLSSAVTFIVGFVAYAVYKKQQIDKKKDAANIILLEIKNAESELAKAKEIFIRDKQIPESILVMKTSSWDKYSYLFVRDLTNEEWNLINTFYEKCAQYNEIVKYNNTFFKKNEEQIRINLHQALAGYTKQFLENIGETLRSEATDEEKERKNKANLDDYQGLLNGFYDTFMNEIGSMKSRYFYRPQKTVDDINVIINTTRLDLSTSTIGTKLTSIINRNIRIRIAEAISGKRKHQ